MIDDEDAKVRRNLVAASAAVIVVWFLEVPIARLLNAKLGAEWNVDQWRVWAVTLGVLLYLALRFRFRKEGASSFFQPTIAQYRSKVRDSALLHVSKYHPASEHKPNALGSVWAQIDKDLGDELRPGIPKEKSWSLKFERIEVRGAANPFEGQAEVFAKAEGPDVPHGPSGSRTVKFSVAHSRRLAIRLRSAWEAVIYSPDAVDRLIPAFLWLFAFIIAAVRLVDAAVSAP